MRTKKQTSVLLIGLLAIYLFAAMMLQVLAGHVDVRRLAFPVGTAIGGSLCAVLFVLDREYSHTAWERLLRSPATSCLLLGLATVASVVGGFMPQAARFATTWWFVAIVVLLLTHLTLVIIHRLRRFTPGRDASFMLVHIGLWLALFSGTAGAGDTLEMRALVRADEEATMAVDERGMLHPLGYALRLYDFHVERDQVSGTPIQYEADILKDNTLLKLTVNAPISVSLAEKLYLMSYHAEGEDADAGADTVTCVVQIVRQPWSIPMLAGIVMMMAGTVWYVWTDKNKGRRLPCC